MNTLTAAEQARVAPHLRPEEGLLWVGKPCTPLCPAPTQSKGIAAVIAHMFGGKTQASAAESSIYLLTDKRAIVLPPKGDAQIWPLMLGMIQKVNQEPDGSGDVIFDHDYDERTETRAPRGFLRVADADRVRMLVSSAADAAYNASPWSV